MSTLSKKKFIQCSHEEREDGLSKIFNAHSNISFISTFFFHTYTTFGNSETIGLLKSFFFKRKKRRCDIKRCGNRIKKKNFFFFNPSKWRNFFFPETDCIVVTYRTAVFKMKIFCKIRRKRRKSYFT